MGPLTQNSIETVFVPSCKSISPKRIFSEAAPLLEIWLTCSTQKLGVVWICGADLSDLPDTPEELLEYLTLGRKTTQRRAKARAKSEDIGDNLQEDEGVEGRYKPSLIV